MIALVLFLQVLDGVSTYHVIKDGGRELNPIVGWCIDHFDLYWGLLVAKGWAVVAILIAAKFGVWTTFGGFVALCVIALLYVAIVINNLRVLYR